MHSRTRSLLWIGVSALIVFLAVIHIRAAMFIANVEACFNKTQHRKHIVFAHESVTSDTAYVTAPSFLVRQGDWGRFLAGAFASVEEVSVTSPTRDQLIAIGNLRSVKTLIVDGPATAESSVWQVIGSSPLRIVNLQDTGIDDMGFQAVVGKNAISELRLIGERNITLRSLGTIGHSRALTSLHLHDLQSITLQDWEYILSDLPSLDYLVIGGDSFGDDALKSVSRLPRLRWLLIAKSSVTDIGLRDLTASERIESLHVHSTPVSLAGALSLAGMRSLKELTFTRTKIRKSSEKELKDIMPHCKVVIAEGAPGASVEPPDKN